MTNESKISTYSRLKRKVALLCEDINFIRSCLKKKVIPNFVKISVAVTNARSNKAKKCAEKEWLKTELKFMYKKLSETELIVYSMHLEFTKSFNYYELDAWNSFSCELKNDIDKLVKKKRLKQKRKLLKLIDKYKGNSVQRKPEFLPDFVINRSNETFSEDELMLLNKGLKYSPKPSKVPLLPIVLDVETVLKPKIYTVKENIRKRTLDVLKSTPQQRIYTQTNEFETVKQLREKECYYVKADKGNKLVIMNKSDYDTSILNLIDECNYKQVRRNPLPKMIRECDELRQSIKNVFGPRLSRLLNVSNPSVAKMYGLPKIHKPGNKMRPIVSNINTPCYAIAKWLVKEVKMLPPINSLSVKNSLEFAEKMKDIIVGNDEVLVSFDVTSLFPSIPVDVALNQMEIYLNNCNIPNDKKQLYICAARLCMRHSYFQFRDKFYVVEKGTNMGNPLSPMISEFFMSHFEIELKELNLLPRIWYRYVDDVCAIVKKNRIEETLNVLNNRFETIRFTHETEIDNKLPFLDLEMQKQSDGSLQFAIYRKPTSTLRTITSDSNCSIKHKHAAFHSMVHRLCHINLSVSNYMREYKIIKEIARVNGYDDKLIDDLIVKHTRKKKNDNLTTLLSQNRSLSEKNIRVALSYVPEITGKIKNIFHSYKMDIVHTNQNKLSNLLGTTKDKTADLQKSGIYKIECGDCDEIYIGQTKRKIEQRIKEHKYSIRCNHAYSSAYAAHVLENNHFSECSVSLVHTINDYRQLDAYESYEILRDDNVMNLDNGNIESPLIAYLVHKQKSTTHN